ncbi:MAG TPA: TOBE domain-containing protein [Steroidobacteraceae bacterium]|jgi:molybdate transport system regulatory protein|nr:TOBE domain-containing protein [Steroidobacteraceae bacterium]
MAKRSASIAIHGGLWLDRKGQKFVGASRIALLQSIDRTGSITRAAKEVGLSYKAAWDAVDAMNNVADKPLLIRTTGGQHGGGSHLTEHGRALVRLYRLLESGYQHLLAQMQAQVHDFSKLNELMKAITMKTSARNQFRGIVREVRTGAVNADVILDLGDGLEIFANITNDAVEDLGLKPGRDAVALIKASFIVLSPDANLRVSARNQLRGTVTAVIPGSVNCEVKIQLSGGRVLTAIVTSDALKELDLAEGAACSALIKSSHVLIAVND